MDNDRDILLIAIFTFLTVSIWIFFELTKTSKTQTVASQYTEILAPLDPSLDIETVQLLNQRTSFR